jgi:hypothetical protein
VSYAQLYYSESTVILLDYCKHLGAVAQPKSECVCVCIVYVCTKFEPSLAH